MKIVNLEQGSKEWHEFRQGKIGASDAASIMGLCPYKTPLMKWEEKIQGSLSLQTDAMRRGTELEPKARDWYNARFNSHFKPIVAQHDQYDWMIASLDGWNGEQILEIKCPGKIETIIPDAHYAQLQHQLAVTGVNEAIYLQFDGEAGIAITVTYDSQFIAELIEAEEKFYNSLLSFEPPEPTDRDFVEESNEIIIHYGETYQQIDAQIKFLEEQKSELKAKIVSNAKHSRMKVGPIKLVKVNRKGNIDYKAIPQLQGLDLEPYRKKNVSYWEITCSKEEAIV